EENYRICELAYEQFGTPNLVVRLNDRAWMNRFYALGARIVDPGTAIVGLLDQFVRSPSSTSLLLGMEEDQVVEELELRNPNLHGLALRDLRLPLDTLILSIRRQGQLLISHGYTRLAVGDRITLVGPKKSLQAVALRFDINRESALVNLVEQVTPREIAGKSLESEVKEMIRPAARPMDDQPRDRFDRFIEESLVIDIKENIDVETLYGIVAAALSEKLAMTSDELLDLFIKREKESSTAITQGLAIPHIIIEGHHKFCILLVRCNNGIYFSESAPMVYAVFVLIGTRDERTFHLQALSAIAQVVQNTGFEKRWRRARGEQALRNVILSANRKRLL
ncbi:MAG: PTS sugar transporter subunit IIA, partial [Desulfosudaceae bacterium]